MDAHEILVLQSETSFTCLGKGGEFVLIDNSAHDATAHLEHFARQRGYVFCGIFGLNKDGIPRVEAEAHPTANSR